MWQYEQNTGKLFRPNGQLLYTGYAGGNCGKNPEGINNHDMQGIHSVGPLPVGIYTFGEPVEGSHLGPFAIPLIPDADNAMFGRGGFFMHGDTTPSGRASEGCIIQPRFVRNECHASQEQKILVYFKVINVIH
jgi:Tlde1 domain